MMKWFRKSRRAGKWLLIAALLGVVAVVSGCRTLGFYAQAFKGQYQLLTQREPIAEVIADTNTPPRLRTQLELVQRLRRFAQEELKLPVDGHYQNYVDVKRPYVVWNVQAAPQFSLEPKTWWYPLVGSLEYRGYFSPAGASNEARRLKAKGYDVYSAGVEAYSTLGWFRDPVLNTFINRREPELAEVIFHELGHQRVFARGDTDFNEAFATVVGEEGARRWLKANGRTNVYEQYLKSIERNEQFVRLVFKARTQLEKLYGDRRDKDGRIQAADKLPAPPEDLRREKQRIFEELRREYALLKEQWGGARDYDYWFSHELNNAQLNTIANYFDFVPGFLRLLELQGGDLEKFYAHVEKLSKMDRDERHQWLRDLARKPEPERVSNAP